MLEDSWRSPERGAPATVADLLRPDPKTVSPLTSILDAARLMRDLGIDAIVVADRDEVIGLVTDRDLVVRAIADDRLGRTVGAVMTRRPASCVPQTSLAEALGLMSRKGLDRLLVMDAGALVGFVLRDDVVAAVDGARDGRAPARSRSSTGATASFRLATGTDGARPLRPRPGSTTAT